MSYNAPTNMDDVIDSRSIIERIDTLESDLETAVDAGEKDEAEEIREELEPLREFAAEAKDVAEDWIHGAGLIRDSYFVDYAQDFADDIGAVSSQLDWPGNCIDWEQAARELQMDYSIATFDGVDYWVR